MDDRDLMVERELLDLEMTGDLKALKRVMETTVAFCRSHDIEFIFCVMDPVNGQMVTGGSSSPARFPYQIQCIRDRFRQPDVENPPEGQPS